MINRAPKLVSHRQRPYLLSICGGAGGTQIIFLRFSPRRAQIQQLSRSVSDKSRCFPQPWSLWRRGGGAAERTVTQTVADWTIRYFVTPNFNPEADVRIGEVVNT